MELTNCTIKQKTNPSKSFIYNNSAQIITLMLIVIGALISPSFLTLNNFTNVMRQTSFYGIMAIGMTYVILTGGIDLSVGSVFAFAGVFTSYIQELPLFLIILVTLVLCALMGTLNGLFVARLNIAPFIVTLATMMGYRGICLLLTDGGITRNISNEAFINLGRGDLFGIIPIPVVILLTTLFISIMVLKFTPFGRKVYAIGGNVEAARMMGINPQTIKIFTYTISGVFAGLAGLLMAARMGSGEPVAGTGSEMNAISAIVLGGTLLSGGKGNVVGTFFGALVLTLINNMMNMMGNMSSQVQNVVMGGFLIVIVVIQSKMTKK